MACSAARRLSVTRSEPAPQARARTRFKLAASNLLPINAVKVSAGSTSSPTEAQLVAQAQAGDTRAFEMLVIKYQKRVIYLASRLVGVADAPDVAQIAFVKAWRKLKDFKGESQFFTWLYRITLNAAKTELSKGSRHWMSNGHDITDAEMFGNYDQLSDFNSPDSIVIANETRILIGKAVNRLAPIFKEAITLREVEGLSYDEIAAVQCVPVGTVRSRIFRARSEIDLVFQ